MYYVEKYITGNHRRRRRSVQIAAGAPGWPTCSTFSQGSLASQSFTQTPAVGDDGGGGGGGGQEGLQDTAVDFDLENDFSFLSPSLRGSSHLYFLLHNKYTV